MSVKYWIFKTPIMGKKLKMLITKLTGGMQESVFIRKYFKDEFKIDVGLYSYGGCFSEEFNLGGEIKIGRYCSIAPNCRYLAGNHPLNYISTSPYFYNKRFSKDVQDIERGTLEIGNDCWIGYGAIITNKCKKIGNGAVIAAGAIVTKDVPEYAIVAGSPARIIKYRFDKETIEALNKSNWWDFPPQILLKYYKYVSCPIEFCRRLKYEKEK